MIQAVQSRTALGVAVCVLAATMFGATAARAEVQIKDGEVRVASQNDANSCVAFPCPPIVRHRDEISDPVTGPFGFHHTAKAPDADASSSKGVAHGESSATNDTTLTSDTQSLHLTFAGAGSGFASASSAPDFSATSADTDALDQVIIGFTVTTPTPFTISADLDAPRSDCDATLTELQPAPGKSLFFLPKVGADSASGTLEPGDYRLALCMDANTGVAATEAPSASQTDSASGHLDLTVGGAAHPTTTALSCPGDTTNPQTAADPGVAITCHVTVDDNCAATCSPSPPTGAVTIDFADGLADPSCNLTQTSQPRSVCDVSVTPSAAGSHEIAADYAGDGSHAPSAGRTTFTTNCAPAQGQQVKVGNAVALGCFAERTDANGKGTGVFETSQMAWIGGFEAVPDPGAQGVPAKLVVDTNTSELREEDGQVELRIDGTPLPLPVADLPVKLPSGDVELGRSGSIDKAVLDLPLDGKLKVAWASGGTAAQLDGEVSVSKVTSAIGLVTTTGSGSTADFKFSAKVSNGKGLEVSSAEAKVDEIDVTPKIFKLPRPLALKDLTFDYSRKIDPATGLSRPFWSAGGLISWPFSKSPIDLGGKVFVFDGSIAGAGIAVDGINKPIPDTPLFLQRISGDLAVRPDLGLNTSLGATFGPRFAGKQLFTLDGSLTAGALVSATDCSNGPDPFKIAATMKFVPFEDDPQLAKAAKVDLTQRICSYASFAQLGGVNVPGLVGQDVTMEGKLDFFRGLFGYEGTQSGFVGNHGANLEGSATLKLPGVPDLTGRVIVSSIGIAACGGLNGAQVGFGYRWGDPAPAPYSFCDYSAYKVAAATAGAPGGGGRAAQVASGLPSVAFAVTGSAGAPRLRVNGPGGVTFSSPPDGGALHTRQVLIAPSPAESKTYVIVKAPAGGTWRFVSRDAANVISSVAVANGLPHPRVGARLRRLSHEQLALHYRLAPIPGQTVDFIERGPATERRLGTAHDRRGTIRFRPFIAARTQRTILAEVIQNGRPRATIPLARYHAPAAHRPARPHVTARRSRTTVRLRWHKIRGATGYVVIAKAGHTELAGLFARSTHLTIPNVPRTRTIRITVRAASNITPPGPAAALRLKPHR